MTGGGFGGCAIALIEASAADAVERTVLVAFREAGLPDPVSFLVTAADGAGSDL